MEKTFSEKIEFQGEFNVSKILESINQIRQELGNNKNAVGLLGDLDKQIDRLNNLKEKAEEIKNNQISSPKDVETFSRIQQKIKDVTNDITTLARRANDQSHTIGIEKMREKLQEASSNVKNITADIEKLRESLIGVDPQNLYNMTQEFEQGVVNGEAYKAVVDEITNSTNRSSQALENAKATYTNFLNANQAGIANEIRNTLDSKSIQSKQFNFGDSGKNLDWVREKYIQIASEGANAIEVMDRFREQLKEVGIEIKDVSVKKLTETTTNLFSSISNEDLNKLRQYYNDYQKAINVNNTMARAQNEQMDKIGKLSSAYETLRTATERQKVAQENLNKAENNTAVESINNHIGTLTSSLKEYSNETDNSIKKTRQLVDSQVKLDTGFSQLVYTIGRYFSVFNILTKIRQQISETFEDVKVLDKAFGSIAMVTEKQVSDLWQQYDAYAEIAKEYGQETSSAVEASALFYQQGLKQNEVLELTKTTMIQATLAQTDFSTATQQLTAALRGYNMDMMDSMHVTDVYSELAAHAAASVNDIAYAMSKTASIANSAGSSFENTAAFLTQMVETTQESAENLGTALKTIVARFSEMKKNISGTSESEFADLDINKIDTALKTVGIQLKDQTTGIIRDFDDVILELSSIWDTLDRNTQRYIATIAAGSRQQSRFLALVSDYDRLTELTDIAANSEGRAQEQYEKYADTIENKLNKLKTTWEQFRVSLLSSDLYKDAIAEITHFVEFLNDLKPRDFIAFTTIFLTLGRIIVQNLITGIKSSYQLINTSFTNIYGKIQNVVAKSGSRFFQGLTGTFALQLESGFEAGVQKAETQIQELDAELETLTQKRREIDIKLTGADAGLVETLKNRTGQRDVQRREAAQSRLRGYEREGAEIDNAIVQNRQQADQQKIQRQRAVTQLENYRQNREKIDEQNAKIAQAQGMVVGQAFAVGITTAFTEVIYSKKGPIQSALSVFVTTALATVPVIVTSVQSMIATEKTLMTALGASVGPLAAIAGAIAGIVLAIKGVQKLFEWLKKEGWKKLVDSSEVVKAEDSIKKLDKQLEKTKEKLSEISQEYNELKDNNKTIKDNIEIYEKLNNKIYKTEEEQQQYNNSINSLAETLPVIVDHFDEYGNAVLKTKEEYEGLIAAQKELEKVKASEYYSTKISEDRLEIEKAQNEFTIASGLKDTFLQQDPQQLKDTYKKVKRVLEVGELNESGEIIYGEGDKESRQEIYSVLPYDQLRELLLKNGYKEKEIKSYEAIAKNISVEDFDKIINNMYSQVGNDLKESSSSIALSKANLESDVQKYIEAQLGEDYSFAIERISKRASVRLKNKEGLDTPEAVTAELDKMLEEEQKQLSDLGESTIKIINDFYSDGKTIQERKDLIDKIDNETEKVRTEDYLNALIEKQKQKWQDLLGKETTIPEQIEFNDDTLKSVENLLSKAEDKGTENELKKKIKDIIQGTTSETNKTLALSYDWESVTGYNVAEQAEQFAELSDNEEEATKLFYDYLAALQKAKVVNLTGTMTSEREALDNSLDLIIDNISKFEKIQSSMKEQFKQGHLDIKDLTGKKGLTEITKALGTDIQDYITYTEEGYMQADFSKLIQDLIADQDKTIDEFTTRITANKLRLKQIGEELKNNSLTTQEQSNLKTEQENLKTLVQNDEELRKEWLNLSKTYSTALIDTYKGAFEEETQDLLEANEKASESAKKAKDNLDKLNDTLKNNQKSVEDAAEKVQDAKAKIDEAVESLAEANKTLEETIHGTDNFSSNLDGLINYTNQLKELNTEIETIESNLKKVGNAAEASQLYSNLGSSFDKKSANLQAQNLVINDALNNIRNVLANQYGNYISFDNQGAAQISFDYMKMDANDEIRKSFETQFNLYNEYRDKLNSNIKELNNLETKRKDIYKNSLNDIVSLQEKVIAVLKSQAEEEVNITKEKYDALSEADDAYLEALEDAINKQKKLREEEQKWNDLATKEKKLSLMRRDTSGANAIETQNLEKEIQDNREELLSSSVDNIINNLKELYEMQKEERELELEYMEEATANTEKFAEWSSNIMNSWTSLEDMQSWFLENNKETQDYTVEQTEKYLFELEDSFIAYQNYIGLKYSDISANSQFITDEINALYNSTSENVSNVGDVTQRVAEEAAQTAIEQAQKAVEEAQNAVVDAENAWQEAQESYNEAMEKLQETQQEIVETKKELQNAESEAVKTHQEAMNLIVKESQNSMTSVATSAIKAMAQIDNINLGASTDEEIAALRAWAENNRYISNGVASESFQKALEESGSSVERLGVQRPVKYEAWIYPPDGSARLIGTYGSEQEANNALNPYSELRQQNRTGIKQYKEGGLIDETGFIWADGTKVRPESFLDAEDTIRIGELTRLLAERSFDNLLGYSPESSSTNIGDTNIEIHINIENMKEEEDMDILTENIKNAVLEASNSIGKQVILHK